MFVLFGCLASSAAVDRIQERASTVARQAVTSQLMTIIFFDFVKYGTVHAQSVHMPVATLASS